ncbi:hypothetical protein AeMF1_005653 [Aphanomyces euteiches]|nr:hypothetical protein AeMF1_005653 [Aphanomyces euteiches]KAH9197403.1 hypothetical protein AeNC1_000615 [Aphanomyces euteiches]
MEARRILEETEVYETPEVEVYPNKPSGHLYAHMDDVSMKSELNEIDRAPLRPADAFHAFLGTSAKIPGQQELQVVPRGDLETPTMRYHRLQQELGELERDLELLENLSKDSTDPPTYRTMLLGLKSLQANLSQLQLDPVGATHAEPHIQAQRQLSAKLWKDIETFRQGAGKDSAGDKTPGLVYEVFAVQEEDKSATLKLAAVEQRVAQLERLVGSSFETTSLIHSLQDLETRMSLLNPSQVEALSHRVAGLLNDFSSIAKLQDVNPAIQQSILTAKESSQLTAMYDQLQTVSTTAAAIPVLVDKLNSLKSLHDDAATFRDRLETLERNTNNLSTILDTDTALLANMEANLAKNLAVFQSNMEQLDQRMQKLLNP